MMKFGFGLVGLLAILYGILGLLHREVWVQFKGWILLSKNESITYLVIGTILVLFGLDALKNKNNNKK